MFSVLLKTIVIALASTANAQSYTLRCNNQVDVPSGCLDYGYCAGGGFIASCSRGPTECQNGHQFCFQNCACVRN
ncbi:secreted protein [Melampsora americana]|nr:secreted protein [Melampsora americana]